MAFLYCEATTPIEPYESSNYLVQSPPSLHVIHTYILGVRPEITNARVMPIINSSEDWGSNQPHFLDLIRKECAKNELNT